MSKTTWEADACAVVNINVMNNWLYWSCISLSNLTTISSLRYWNNETRSAKASVPITMNGGLWKYFAQMIIPSVEAFPSIPSVENVTRNKNITGSSDSKWIGRVKDFSSILSILLMVVRVLQTLGSPPYFSCKCKRISILQERTENVV